MFLNKENKAFIIAEAGVNHNGDINNAIKLIEYAKRAGCDAVKFQTFDADRLVCKDAPKVKYQISNDGSERSQYEMLKKLMLSNEQFKILKEICDKNSIEFMSTPYDEIAVDFLLKIGIKKFKVASADIVDPILNKAISKTRKKVIISTGMATIQEINNCLKIYNFYSKEDICLLHCVSNYPCSKESLNLKILNILKKLYGTSIGFSDHTTDSISSAMAVSLGSDVIEKHFTLDRNAKGPDHKSSLDFKSMKNFVDNIREIEIILGNEIKQCQSEEKEMREIARKKIIAKNSIKKGDNFSLENLTLKRSAHGIECSQLYEVLEKKSNRDIPSNYPIYKNDFE